MTLHPSTQHVLTLADLGDIDHAIAYDAASSVGAATASLVKFRAFVEAGSEVAVEGSPAVRLRTVSEFDEWVRARFPAMEQAEPFVRKDGSRPTSSPVSRFRWLELGPKPVSVRLHALPSAEQVETTPSIVRTLYASIQNDSETVVWARDDLHLIGILCAGHEPAWRYEVVYYLELVLKGTQVSLRLGGQLPSAESVVASARADEKAFTFIRLLGRTLSDIGKVPYREAGRPDAA